MNWAKLIKDLQQAGMTQAEIAASVGCSRPHISDIATGRRGRRMAYEVGAGLVRLHAEHAAPNSADHPQIAEEPSRMSAIARAIDCLGTQEKLAKAIDLTQAAISQYVIGLKRPSAEVAIRIEAATRGRVRVEDIRPDVPWHVIRGSRAA